VQIENYLVLLVRNLGRQADFARLGAAHDFWLTTYGFYFFQLAIVKTFVKQVSNESYPSQNSQVSANADGPGQHIVSYLIAHHTVEMARDLV